MSSRSRNVIRGILGAVVSIAIIAFGIAWATAGVSLGQACSSV